jgi:hypothetical protein
VSTCGPIARYRASLMEHNPLYHARRGLYSDVSFNYHYSTLLVAGIDFDDVARVSGHHENYYHNASVRNWVDVALSIGPMYTTGITVLEALQHICARTSIALWN